MNLPPEIVAALVVAGAILIGGAAVYGKALLDRRTAGINEQTAKTNAAADSIRRQTELENIGLKHTTEIQDLNLKLQSSVTDLLERQHRIELAAERDRATYQLQLTDLRIQATTASENRANAQELLNMEREARERVEKQAKADQDQLQKRVDELSDENKKLQEKLTLLDAKVVDLEARDKERHDAINEASARESEREVYYASVVKMNELAIGKLSQLAEGNPDLKDWLDQNGLKTAGNINVLVGLTAKLRDKDSAIRARDEHIARLNDQLAEAEKSKVAIKAAESAVGESASR